MVLPGCKRPHNCERCFSEELMECVCDIDSDDGEVCVSPPNNVTVQLDVATFDSGEELSDVDE